MEHLYHFDLTQDPFQNEPDLRFYYESEAHRRAQLRVDRALRQSKGLTVLTGEGGTGKSLLARRIFENLEEEIIEAALMVMMQGTADAASVLRRFASQLGVDEPARERPALLAQLYDQLSIIREEGRHAVLILDDAQVLGTEAMGEIAGLLNLEYEDRRLVSLLLVGLPELDSIVAQVPALGERIEVRVPLQPLGEADSVAYIKYRVQIAGGESAMFESAALTEIFKQGGGRPRHMNSLADNALFEAYLGKRPKVSSADVASAAADLGLGAAVHSVAAGVVHERVAAVPAPVAAPAIEAAPRLPTPRPGTPIASAEITNPMASSFAARESSPAFDDADDDLGSLLEESASNDAHATVLTLGDELDFGLSGQAESTKLLDFEEDQSRGALEPGADETDEPVFMADETDADEIDDLFVELLDD